ncbi:MAG: hypothetical protein JXK94_06040 [Deltaproteobacteria bacterium]|nr:hypothetical protein [Deltaproteobacteria bacterium]
MAMRFYYFSDAHAAWIIRPGRKALVAESSGKTVLGVDAECLSDLSREGFLLFGGSFSASVVGKGLHT